MSFVPGLLDDFEYACDLAMSLDGDGRVVCVDAEWDLVDAEHISYYLARDGEILVSGKTDYSLHEIIRNLDAWGMGAMIDAVEQSEEDGCPISAYVLPL